MIKRGLKHDIARLMGSLFGKDTELDFEKYYEESSPQELLAASRDMLARLLGPQAAEKHLNEIMKKYPELKKMEVEAK